MENESPTSIVGQFFITPDGQRVVVERVGVEADSSARAIVRRVEGPKADTRSRFRNKAVARHRHFASRSAVLVGSLDEIKGATLMDDKEARQQVQPYFMKITQSRKRARKLQTEINRLKKKTQAIIDKLP